MKSSENIRFSRKKSILGRYFSKKWVKLARKLIVRLLQLSLLLIFPFVLLVRVAVWMHDHYAFQGWFCLCMGAMVAAVILFAYINYLHDYYIGKTLSARTLQRNYAIVLMIVLIYCANSIWSISAANVKEAEVKKEFRSLHPVLRLGISTLILIDKDLILTDAERKPEDYRDMGLPSKRYSLHYAQSTGYAHAVDIRTKGHSWLRNKLIQSYFRLMGFNTLMHVGTAEHLHISLSSRDRPGGI